MEAGSFNVRYALPSSPAQELPLGALHEPNGTDVFRLPAAIGRGQIVKTHLRSGLSVSVSECYFQHTYTARIRRSQSQVFLIVPFVGRTVLDTPDGTMPVELVPGMIYCYRPACLELVRMSDPHARTSNIVVELPEAGTGADITGGLCAALEWEVRDQVPRVWSSEISLPMRCAAEQIHGCALFGSARSLFCESRVLDILVRVMRVSEGPMRLTRCRNLGVENRRALMAAEIITQDLENPPSLFELARKVKLSHTDLNRRFRELFGCTAFEYLRRERLRRARELLEHGDLSLTQVAMTTGFCSSSHFSRAFAKEFGMNPSRYRSSVLRGLSPCQP